MRRYFSVCACALSAASLSLASVCYAQDALTQEAQAADSYPRSYFDQYAPATAFEMIVRIPGFNLSGANFGRGLGQGGANVLINGERLTGKTDVGAQLSRIGAANVIQINIVDGAALKIPGLSGQVANIITKSTGISGTFEWTPEFRPRLEPNWFRGAATLSGETGNLSYTLGVRNNAFRQGTYGLETLSAADGTVFELRDEQSRDYGDQPGFTADLNWTPKPGHIGNLNLEYNESNYIGTENSFRNAVTARGETLVTQFRATEDEWNASAGADYEFPLPIFGAKGKFKTIGYFRFENSPTLSQFEGFEGPRRIFGSRFVQDADEGEAIIRSEYSWTPKTGRDWQFGLEGAFNYLDITSALALVEGENYVEAPLNDATSRVEEQRAETTLTHSRTLSPKWDMQASIGVEYSEISQTGVSLPNEIIRDFIRPKGFLSVTYKPTNGKLWRAKLDRQVGQLSFFDFISSVSVIDDLDRAGNVNLVPAQTWRAELAYERDFGQGNTWNTTLDGSLISDLVDRIPVGVDGDAVGNIDTAYTYALHSDVTLKGEKWNFDGTELNLGFGLHFSHVDDPLENFDRRLNGDSRWHWNVGFRHDIPNTDYAYGFDFNQQRNAPVYRLRTVQQFTFKGPFAAVFVEHKDIAGLKLNFQLSNLFESSDDFDRIFYTQRRDLGRIDFTESREREFGMILRARLSGTF
jgi:hypothetical protein